ncbi:MAG: hypothetical protein ACOCVM_01705 [Desulfovibrionaceae bacterium]
MMKLIIAIAALALMVWAAVGVKYYLDNRVELVELDSRVDFDGKIDAKAAQLKQWEIRTLNYAISKNEGAIKRIHVLIEPEDPDAALHENSTLAFNMLLRLSNEGSVEVPKRTIRRKQLAELVYQQVESLVASVERLSSMPELQDKNITRFIN